VRVRVWTSFPEPSYDLTVATDATVPARVVVQPATSTLTRVTPSELL
jgi:hypothetical protein